MSKSERLGKTGDELKLSVEQVSSRKIARLNLILRLRLQLGYLVISRISPGFPNGYCDRVAPFLSERFNLKFVQGIFTTDDDFSSDKGHFHAWNVDAEGAIIDFTAAQFNYCLKQRIPSGVLIVRPEDPLHERYIPKK